MNRCWQRKPKSFAVRQVVADEVYGYGPFETWDEAHEFAQDLVGGGQISIVANV